LDAQAADQDFLGLERLLCREQVQGSGDFVRLDLCSKTSLSAVGAGVAVRFRLKKRQDLHASNVLR
jgi:hypothetical protein